MLQSIVSLADQPVKASSAIQSKLEKLGIFRRFDLILHLPLRYEDETHLYPIAAAPWGQVILVEGTVALSEVQIRPRKQLIARIQDSSGQLNLRFIHFYPSQQKQLAKGQHVRVLGEIRRGFFGAEMVHPKVSVVEPDAALADRLTPIYPTVSGISQPSLRKLIRQELEDLSLADTLPDGLLNRLGLVSFESAIRLLHAPSPEYGPADLQNSQLPAWQRLKFDELLAQQLSMRLAYQQRRTGLSPKISPSQTLQQALKQQLPFALTNAQERVLKEIAQDLAGDVPMNRLLQGDVGSGKTIVAAMAALSAIEAGYQVALMAPTEILAEQHYQKLSAWLGQLGIEVAWLSGSLRKKAKTEMAGAIALGQARLAVGTHALFQKDIEFESLGLVIVDEQHRFGVGQRLALQSKGQMPHQLMMSATPIPRTLAMSYYADLDVSIIDELPPGRTPVTTKLINADRRDEVIDYVQDTCKKGGQAYWVCPLIEESEALQLETAVNTHDLLKEMLPELGVGLVHGRMKPQEKAEVMRAFSANELQVLVATTVIEVGVDVPNASLMVIEHAERMGLSQLHQLRGRVGRGAKQSFCVLLFATPLSDVAKSRLRAIYESTDGFEIAKQDLLLRGPGEFLGARQSGLPMLRFADLEEDIALLEEARRIAPLMLERESERAKAHMARYLAGRAHFLKA